MDVKFTKTDAYLILIFFVIAIPVTYSGYDYSKGLYVPTMDTIVYCVTTVFLSYVIVYKLFPYFFPKNQFVRLFFFTGLLMMIVGVIEIICYRLIMGMEILGIFEKAELWFLGIGTSAQNSGILIGILLGKKYTDIQLDMKKRDVEMRENELRLLKAQVDPHFLFNNLNTVDSLIDTDPKTAKLYLSKLSHLYRYLIHTKDDEVVALEDELTFARSYAYLLEQRYGGAYSFKFDVVEENDRLIPPGALQTCLENVVKHNGGTEQLPIVTTVRISEDFISVSNNKTAKVKLAESTGIGLTNLKKRYELLSDRDISIVDKENFVIKLPLLKSVE